MNETYKTLAIVLARYPARENDCRVIVYAKEQGKLELVARGTKRIASKLAGHLEPFNLAEIMVVKGRNFSYAGSALAKKCRRNLKSDLEKLAQAGKSAAMLNKLIKPGVKDEEIFAILDEYFEVLGANMISREAKAPDYELFFGLFMLKILSRLGFTPQLYNCLNCGKAIDPQGNIFNTPKGGLVCQDCKQKIAEKHENIDISTDGIKVLRLALSGSMGQLSKLKLNKKLSDELKTIIGSFTRDMTSS